MRQIGLCLTTNAVVSKRFEGTLCRPHFGKWDRDEVEPFFGVIR